MKRNRWIKHSIVALLLTGTVLAGVIFASHGTQTPVTTTPSVTEHLNSEYLTEEAESLPKEDIERFVTAIALINHYYIKNVKDDKLFDYAISGMVSSLDPHSSFLNADDLKELDTAVSGEFVGIGIELTMEDGALKVISPIEGSPAEKAGLKSNDLIIKVDGTLVTNMSLDEAIKRIKGRKGTPVKLTVVRKSKNKPLHFTIIRNTIKIVSVKSELYENNFGYVRITFFQGPVEEQLAKAIHNLKKQANGHLQGLILDLRNNPGGLLDQSAAVADDFLDAKKLNNQYHDYIVYTKGRIPGSNIHLKATDGELIPNTPMVVLINGGSASASEIVAGALQDYKRAIIAGTRSFGKGSVQTILPINKDSAIKLTTALYYTPAGREIQARGIVPDITIPDITVKNISDDYINVDEATFQNHLNNGGNEVSNTKAIENRKAMLKSELELAKKDYQLYQALMMLKGVDSLSKI